MHADPNPFAPPATNPQPTATGAFDAAAAAVRQEHLKYEWSVKFIGWLYLILGFVFVAAAVVSAVWIARGGGPIASAEATEGISTGAFILATFFAVFHLWLGRGLIALNNAARIGGFIYSILLLIVGAISLNIILFLIQALVFHYLGSAKGRYVCSPEYQDIVRKTPGLPQQAKIHRTIWGFGKAARGG